MPHFSSLPPSFSSDKVFVASAGFQADGVTLHKVLTTAAVRYAHAHARPLPAHAAAQLLGNTLYYKRFFPYYAFCLCAGLDEQGVGAEERRQGAGPDVFLFFAPPPHPTLPPFLQAGAPSTPTTRSAPTSASATRARGPVRI